MLTRDVWLAHRHHDACPEMTIKSGLTRTASGRLRRRSYASWMLLAAMSQHGGRDDARSDTSSMALRLF